MLLSSGTVYMLIRLFIKMTYSLYRNMLLLLVLLMLLEEEEVVVNLKLLEMVVVNLVQVI